jgi:hypothetical protein
MTLLVEIIREPFLIVAWAMCIGAASIAFSTK